MKKTNNNSPFYKDWTVKKLKDEARGLYQAIFGEHSCYGTRDLQMYDAVCAELERRGYSIGAVLTINK